MGERVGSEPRWGPHGSRAEKVPGYLHRGDPGTPGHDGSTQEGHLGEGHGPSVHEEEPGSEQRREDHERRVRAQGHGGAQVTAAEVDEPTIVGRGMRDVVTFSEQITHERQKTQASEGRHAENIDDVRLVYSEK